MARYNSALASASITGATTIGSPYSGAFTNLTGTGPYTVTLPAPSAFPGQNQTFYNVTGSTITLSTPAGSFNGTGGSGTSTVLVYNGNVVSITSDGTNYIVISEDGSALVATTATLSGDVTINGGSAAVSITPSTLTIAPTGISNINNVAIGATTRASGAFTTIAANNAVTFTANTSSSSTTTGSLVVTGGVGVSGTVTAATVNATNLGGALSTASQTNVTSLGNLTGLTVDTNTLYVDPTNDRIGIGTTSANGKVEISMAGSTASPTTMVTGGVPVASSSIVLYNAVNGGTTNSTVGIFGAQAGTAGLASGIGFSRQSSGDWGTQIRFYTHPTSTAVYDTISERARIDATGTLLLATTTDPTYGTFPRPTLSIKQLNDSGSGYTAIHIEAAGDESVLGLGYNGDVFAFNTSYRSTGNYRGISFGTSNTERIRITPAGNIGISNSTPQTKFDVNGNIIARGDLFIGTKPSNTLTTGPSNTEWHHIGYAGGTNYHITGSVQGDLTLGAMPGTGIIFGTATNAGDAVPVQRARIAPNGAFSISNGLSVGAGASVGTSLDVGNGINFAGGFIRTAIYALNTYGGNGIIHMKTDQRTNNSNMYRFELVGYDYGSAQVLAGAWVGYLYSASDSAISLGTANWGNRAVCNSVYRSSDGYLVLVADIASYYCSFIIHFQAGATGTFTPTITSTYASTSTSAYF